MPAACCAMPGGGAARLTRARPIASLAQQAEGSANGRAERIPASKLAEAMGKRQGGRGWGGEWGDWSGKGVGWVGVGALEGWKTLCF